MTTMMQTRSAQHADDQSHLCPPVADDADDLASLRQTVREVCDDAGGPAAIRRLDETGAQYDQRLWRLLSEQVGLASLGLPDRVGGMGGLGALATVCEELGHALLPVPFLSCTVLAGQVLARVGGAGEAALERVAGGELAALAVQCPDGWWDPTQVEVTAVAGPGSPRPSADGIEASATDTALLGAAVLDGVVPFVLDGAAAAMLVVAARNADGVDLYLVDTADPAVDVVAVETLDLSRSQAVVTLTDAPARRLTTGGRADAAVRPALDVAAVALAAEQLGGAQACLDMTVTYVGDRRQFGRAVGSFQAVKHTCADMLVLVEGCRSAVVRAVAAHADPDQLAVAASVAQSWCSDAYRTVTAETVQLHGGIGFTWDHDAHLYFRRARADASLLGSAGWHRARLATLLAW